MELWVWSRWGCWVDMAHFYTKHDCLMEKWPNVKFLVLLDLKSSIFWIIWDRQWVQAPNSYSKVNIGTQRVKPTKYPPDTQHAHQIPIFSTNIFKNPATNIVRGSSCIIWCIYHHHLLQNVLSVTLILINFFFH